MGGTAILDELWPSDQPANAPAGSVEVLSSGANSNGEILNLLRESRDAREGSVVEPVVDLFPNTAISANA